MGNRGKATAAPERDLLSSLPPALVAPLLSFGEYIASLDVDFLIFMARKAVRLHDLLVAAGCRPPTAVVLTDHVLDQSLGELVGKRCALVDDTLILGTTLGEAERKLRALGITDVVKVVFAIDKDNWCADIASVDRFFVELDESAMLTFCAAEVEALALAAVPYLTDFPLSRRIRLSRYQMPLIYSLPGWDSYELTSARQETEGIFYYTHLPRQSGDRHSSAALRELWSIVEITKVRSFLFASGRSFVLRIIPIVTLRPLAEARIAELFAALLIEVPGLEGATAATLLTHLTTPRAQLRFFQYFLSLIVGESFLELLGEALGEARVGGFDVTEAHRLFGPWLCEAIDALHAAARKVAIGGEGPRLPERMLQVESVPIDVEAAGRHDLEALFGPGAVTPDADEPRNLFSDLMRIFVEFHKQYEMPARLEARAHKARIFEVSADEAPRRNRLKMGISWSTIVGFLARREGLKQAPLRSLHLSLMLDALVDLGIAVPIICNRNGVLFRAYRHGEDALFGEQEHALAYSVAEGYLDASERSGIPRLTLEKLLVALLRVGVERRFLTPAFGPDGTERVARIGFHRHGAVATIADEPSVFADSQDSWLSRHLVNLRVLQRAGEVYQLGEQPQAGLVNPHAAHEARQLGWLIGRLSGNPATSTAAALDLKDLTLLVTCPQPRDAAGSVLAEYRIFDRWYVDHHRWLQRIVLTSPKSCLDALTALRRGRGYEAMNSARMKLNGYWNRRASAAVEIGAAAFRADGPAGDFLANSWLDVWMPIVGGEHEDQRQVFDSAIRQLGSAFLEISVAMFTIELSLASILRGRGVSSAAYAAICRKALNYLEALRSNNPENGSKALSRLISVCEGQQLLPNPNAAITFAITHLDHRAPGARDLASGLLDDLQRYARKRPSFSVQYVLWYDIIDSLGERSGLDGEALATYRAAISRFKDRVNRIVLGMQREAARQSSRLIVTPSALDSKDDEKHLFFAGPHSINRLGASAEAILGAAAAEGVRIRLLLVNASFAGRAPYGFDGDPVIRGQDFWEFSSRLKRAVRREENRQVGERLASMRSYVWLAGALAKAQSEWMNWHWDGIPTGFDFNQNIDGRLLSSTVAGGRVLDRNS